MWVPGVRKVRKKKERRKKEIKKESQKASKQASKQARKKENKRKEKRKENTHFPGRQVKKPGLGTKTQLTQGGSRRATLGPPFT